MIIRPEKLEALKKILTKNEYSGMTVLSAMGCGHQEGFDGKVFISDIDDVMRIRTGERGKQVL